MKKKKFDKNKLKGKLEVEEIKPPIFSEGVMSTAIAILFFILALFFVLAPLALAGVAGETIYSSLKTLLGGGYFLLPFLFVLLGVSYLKEAKPNLALRSTLGSLLFVFSGLGLLSFLPWENSGGFLGGVFAFPFVKLFDVYFSVFMLFALLVISFIILFDAAPKMEHFSKLADILFRRKKKTDTMDDATITDDELGGRTATDGRTDPQVTADEPTPPVETTPLIMTSPAETPVATKTSLFGMKKKESKALEEEKERTKNEAMKAMLINRTFVPPPLSLLEGDKGKPGVGDIKGNANTIKRTLQQFGIMVEMDEISVGPSVTRYALKPAEGVKLSKISSLQNELSLALAAHPVRIEAPIPGTSLVGIEIPNQTKTIVGMHSLLSGPDFISATKPLFLSLGKSIVGKLHYGSLAKMPHLLVAGTTGSGKSIIVHSMITSLLYKNSPENLRLILIDAKRVELPAYNGIPHLATPSVITNARKAMQALGWAVKEMDRRYDKLEELKLQSIGDYHKKILEPYLKKQEDKNGENDEKLKVTGIPEEDIIEAEMEAKEDKQTKEVVPERMPYFVIVIDELSDLMSTYPKELESSIVRLAQLGRASGIHLIIATQRPSVDVITGLIKANMPTRIAMRVISNTDSRTILDMGGAEKLLGSGDMLYMTGELPNPIRLQAPFISMEEIKKVVTYLTEKHRDELYDTIYIDDIVLRSDPNSATGHENDGEDDLIEDARMEVIQSQKASTSYLQRKLGIGYSRAAKLIDILEEQGVVGPANGSKGREILIKPGTEEYDALYSDNTNADTNIQMATNTTSDDELGGRTATTKRNDPQVTTNDDETIDEEEIEDETEETNEEIDEEEENNETITTRGDAMKL